jgi:hypothetical protein
MNWLDCNIDAVALYGSQLRTDFDHISDRDLLAVGSDINGLCVAKKIFEGFGFSCGVYTWDRLDRMVCKGALFIQHLKQESCVVRDTNGRLQTLLSSYEPKADYEREIEATRNIVALTEYISSSSIATGWALDVLAVAVRNIGILKLANTGRYVFGYAELLDALASTGHISKEACWKLKHLRRWKQLYRNGCFGKMPQVNIVQSFQKLIGKAFDIDFDSKLLSLESMRCSLNSRSHNMADRYCRFRLLEGAVGIYLHENYGGNFEVRQRFNRIVKDQNHYGLFCHDLSRPLQDIAIMLENTNHGQSGKGRFFSSPPPHPACGVRTGRFPVSFKRHFQIPLRAGYKLSAD